MKNFKNIVFILADDLGYWSLGCEGNNDAITPNIDSIAKNGIRFNNFFCTSPVCSPARASLLTGRMPSAHGVFDWILGGNIDTGTQEPIEYLRGQKGYTDYLKQNGFLCGISGKWHLGYSTKAQMGFEHWYVHQAGGGNYYSAPMIRDGKCIREKGYITDLITDDAMRFIEKAADSTQPFYLNVGYTAPHTPWINNHPKEYLDMFKNTRFPSCPIQERHPWQISFPDFEHDRLENLQGYFASIAAMDAGIGKILNLLKQRDLLSSTLVVFTSDNGFNCGHHGIWGKGNGTNPFNLFDTSVKVPFIMQLPGIIEPGRVCSEILSAYDWFPTILDFENISHNEKNLPGKSFLSCINSSNVKLDKDKIYVYDEYGSARMIRSSDWKYIHRYNNGPHELYDLRTDPFETSNCIKTADANLVYSLKNEMEDWFDCFSNPKLDGRNISVTGMGQSTYYIND